MNLEQILFALSSLESDAARSCGTAVRESRVSPTFPPLGKMTVQEASAVYEMRRKTMLSGGIRFEGLDSLLRALAGRKGDEQLTVAAFSGAREAYVVILDGTGAVVGCIYVEKRS